MESSPPAFDPARLRQPYAGPSLTEDEMAADPVTQFTAWFADVVAARLPEPNAMVLATASADGWPSARTVLLKGYDDRGFTFFTNYTSRKGSDLAANPRASLVFPWHAIRRQVIIMGEVTRLPAEESAAYFRSRPHGSQVGAWASERQSAPIGSRRELEMRFLDLERRWPPGAEVPRPAFWGGFRVSPVSVEFWQGRPNRLHDRLRYERTPQGWTLVRLSP